MKINVIKQPGGVLIPASDLEFEKLNKFKTGHTYQIEIKNSRNSAFHGKVFAFFTYCFSFWESENKYQCEQGQFDVFRNQMTVLAGYYDSFYKLDGSVRIEAKSLAFSSMTQEDFEKLYSALIQVAMQKIFIGSDDEVYNKLVGFF